VSKNSDKNGNFRSFLVDFSKAFDHVVHLILVWKLIELHISPFILNWLISFSLAEVIQLDDLELIESCSLPINLSIVCSRTNILYCT
jgi:hypothetical protein